jgi:RNA polymerase sigma-70 factor (ECF subfamily)
VGLTRLMESYCNGDGAAFRAIYDLTAPALRAYLVGLTHCRTTADDLLQEAFLKLHGARASYVRGADPLPWMYTIAHRTFLDDARRRKRARVNGTADGVVPDIAAGIDGRREDEPPDPSTPHELSSALREAIDRLPEPQRTAFELTKLARTPVADAAAELGITVGVKLRAHRALQRLRAELTGAHRAAWLTSNE